MKKGFIIMAFAALSLMLSACGKEGGGTATPTPWYVTATPTPTYTPTPTPTNTPSPTPTPWVDIFGGDEYFAPKTAFDKKLGKYYNNVFENALLSTGNTYRLRQKLDKAKRGEEVVICYFGGSVTVGSASTERTPAGYTKGYAYMSYEYIRDTYGTGDNVKYVNSAISGTGSDLGMVRADEDVLSFEPDIIFIEFAVNNDNSIYNKMTYEGLIRKFLKAENEPAVILLFSAATYAGQNQSYMKPIGTYYGLPMLSMKTGLDVPLNMKQIEWKDFSGDSVHPKTDGHKLYAKCVAYLVNKAYEDKSHTEYIFPETPSVKGWDLYDEAVMIDNRNNDLITDTGCFTAEYTKCSATESPDSHALFNGWTKKAGAEGSGIKLSLTCSSFTVVVKQTNDSSEVSLDVYVDGVLKKNIPTAKSGAWNNPVPTLVFVADDAGQHEIEIRHHEGSEGKAQTILAMAYTGAPAKE